MYEIDDMLWNDNDEDVNVRNKQEKMKELPEYGDSDTDW